MRSFVAPYVVDGDTALSVPIATANSTLASKQASMTFCAPDTFVFTNSNGLYSATGTCFSAAAWNTISTFSIALYNLSLSLMSPIKNLRRLSANLDFMFVCFHSSLLKILILLTFVLNSLFVKAVPRLPVPPVIRIVLPSNIRFYFQTTIKNIIIFIDLTVKLQKQMNKQINDYT